MCLLCGVEHGVGVLRGYYTQINKEAGCMVHSWIKQRRQEKSSVWEYLGWAMVDILCTHGQQAHDPLKKVWSILWVQDLAWWCPHQQSLNSGLFPLPTPIHTHNSICDKRGTLFRRIHRPCERCRPWTHSSFLWGRYIQFRVKNLPLEAEEMDFNFIFISNTSGCYFKGGGNTTPVCFPRGTMRTNKTICI